MPKPKSILEIVNITGGGIALGIAGLVFLVGSVQPAAAGANMPDRSPMALAPARLIGSSR